MIDIWILILYDDDDDDMQSILFWFSREKYIKSMKKILAEFYLSVCGFFKQKNK